MITVTGLTKRYGATTAIAQLDVTVAAGASLAVLGANGSGRTTLLRLLATLVPPTSGAITIAGVDAVRRPHEARRHIAYVSQLVGADSLLAGEYAHFVMAARRRPQASVDARAALKRADVDANAVIRHLSDGQQQRLALAVAVALTPAVLLLDEPFRALDAEARDRCAGWINDLRGSGTTIVAAVNEERDARVLCQRAIRLDGGRLHTDALRAQRSGASATTWLPIRL